MATQTLSQRFQNILDARGLNVTGGYLGNRQLKIIGEPADVDEARKILTCMMSESEVIDYDAEGTLPPTRIVIFDVPEVTAGLYERSVAKARDRGLT